MGQQPGKGFTDPEEILSSHTMMVHDDRMINSHVSRAQEVITILQNGNPLPLTGHPWIQVDD